METILLLTIIVLLLASSDPSDAKIKHMDKKLDQIMDYLGIEDVNIDDFDTYCLQPAIRRRGIIKEQCHFIDVEFKTVMPDFWIKTNM